MATPDEQELLGRTTLETHKLDLMAEISNLKIRLTSSERERQDSEERLHKAQRQVDDLVLQLKQREAEITELKIKLAKNGTIPIINQAQDAEVDKLKKVVESLMCANEEKETKITELKNALKRYRNLEEILQTHGKKGTDLLAMLEGDGSDGTGSSSPPSYTETIRDIPSIPQLTNGDKHIDIFNRHHMMTPTATSTPDGGRYNFPSSLHTPPSTINSTPTSPKSPSIIRSNSCEEIIHMVPRTPPEKKKRIDNPPGHINQYQDQPAVTDQQPPSSTMPRRKSRGFGSFGRGWLKFRSSSKRSCSAPDLAESEAKERADAIKREKDLRAQQYKAMQTANDGKKKKGIKKFFKLKRSNSQEFEIDPNDSFKRGGVRATAGPRLGWSRDVKDELNKPFSRWDSDRVAAWLNEIGLTQYVSECKKGVKNGEQLLKANSHDLEKDMNIKNSFHRKKLLLALQSVKSGELDKFSELDNQWVTRWLDDIGLPQYKDQFVDAKVDGRMLHYLTVEDLLHLKVVSSLHHVSIKRGIQVLRLNNFNPHCLKRRSNPDEEAVPDDPVQVSLWTNHRVMEWLRTIDLSEYAPNLRGSGVHGALMAFEDSFSADLLASLLSIPASKTLLRRHLKTHFIALIGAITQQRKRDYEASPGFAPLTPNMKVKMKKYGLFSSHKRTKSETDFDGFICPMDIQGKPGHNPVKNGVSAYQTEAPEGKKKDDKTAKEIGAFSQEINTLTDMLAREQFLEDDNIPTSNV